MRATALRTAPAATLRVPIVVLAVSTVLLGLLFHAECAAAVRVWMESTAYGHCFLIAPMAAYLAWDRRQSLRGVAPQPWPAAVLLGAPIALGWIAADRLGIMEGRQLAAVAALEVLALAVLGRRLYRALAGPLLYLVFLVPFGAFLTPQLQQFTARFVAVGLTVLGVPNLVTNMTIEIPEGTFYVAEACAGLRFLIAAVAFGVFFALLNYRSPGRRVAFIAASCVIPVVANGFRALGIVMLGHVLGSAEAAETDHILYGWLFFSIVLLLLVAAGLPFRETASASLPGAALRQGVSARSAVTAAAGLLLLVGAGPAAAALLDRYPGDARLASAPLLLPGPGCIAGPAGAESASRYVAHFTCAGLPLLVTIEALPPRATPDRLLDAERRLGGEEGVEDAEHGTLTLAHGEPRQWRLTETVAPTRVTALAAWVGGRAAGSGMAARIRQAWASLGGTRTVPIVVAVQVASGHERLSPTAEAAVRAVLTQFLEAQPGLPGGDPAP
ncbi:MAG: exosortase [Acetobacteraceae bacterium]|nr:exosortase [Acetobacteraceae bacterium]